MYKHPFSNAGSCTNRPYHSDTDDDISYVRYINERYHQEEQTTLLGQHPSSNTNRRQQTSQPYVPENDSSDESDSCELSTDLNTVESSDQCEFEVTSSLSYEDCYGDESNEEYDDYSSEEQSMFLCKHKSKHSCKCRKTCGLYATENDSSSASNSYSSDSNQRDESMCLCRHEIPKEACRCTQNSPMDETYANGSGIDNPGTSQFEFQEASSPQPLSSDEFERKYIDGPESEYSDSKHSPDHPSEYPDGKYEESSQYDQSSGETDDDFKMSLSKQKRRHRQNKREIHESSDDDFTFEQSDD